MLNEYFHRFNFSVSKLTTTDLNEILKNSRRRILIQYLRDRGGSATLRELSERIAAEETGERPPPQDERHNVYVSLHRWHIPKLVDLGVIDYDSDSKRVTFDRKGDELVLYMETVPKNGISWSEFRLGLSILGLLVTWAAVIDVPIIEKLSPFMWAVSFFLIMGVTSVYHTVQQRSSVFHRVYLS